MHQSHPTFHVSPESERRTLLRSLRLLESAPEPEFEVATDVVVEVFGTPMAGLSLIDENRQWFRAKVGLDLWETPREDALCAHVVSGEGVLVVEDLSLHPVFRENPYVAGPPFLRFYAGAPIEPEFGTAIGTLCALDTVPRQASLLQVRLLTLLAHRIGLRLASRRTSVDLARVETLFQESWDEFRKAREVA